MYLVIMGDEEHAMPLLAGAVPHPRSVHLLLFFLLG